MFGTFANEALPPAATQTEFSFKNLVIVAIVFAVVYPLLTKLRKHVSERRRERWAQQEGWPSEPDTPNETTGPADDQR